MSNATEYVRSTRQDARAFAEAFSAADDAFTFGRDIGESRELSLDELGDLLELGSGAPAATAPIASRRASRVDDAAVADSAGADELLTLDELGDALARGERPGDDLDFDFGSSADERARRRTAARLGMPMPEPNPGRRAEPTTASTARRAALPPSSSLAAASAATAARMAGSAQLSRGMALAGPAGKRTLREIEPPQRPAKTLSERFGGNPDRIAMWAVLLGILLILIAFTSGSAGA